MSRFNRLAVVLAFAVSAIGGSAYAQSAPPLTSVEIRNVFSTQAATNETISPSQFSTVLDHGGAQVRVTVREIGYAQTTRTVRLNGAIVSNTALTITNLCGTASSPTTSCSPGQSIIGFDRTYQIDGSTGGSYSVTARNSKTPFNAITDTLNIQ